MSTRPATEKLAVVAGAKPSDDEEPVFRGFSPDADPLRLWLTILMSEKKPRQKTSHVGIPLLSIRSGLLICGTPYVQGTIDEEYLARATN